ncbi:MAG: GreA/GreB family elongation factor [Myxococcales bacterium]|nr:GreA/GreB family elongation factor [Myxococcales bacterium]
MDKQALIAAIRAEIAAESAEMTRLAKEAADAATHEENKPENDKDMRSTEASYLARGQADRVRELDREHAALGALDLRAFGEDDPIEAGAYIEIRAGKQITRCLLAPAGGGRKFGGVQIVTASSPLGAALIGLSVGDEAEVPTPQGPRLYEIMKLS